MRESATQYAIKQYLEIMEAQGKVVYIKNNSGAFKTDSGSFYRMGRPGSSDFIVAVRGGVTLWLEVKTAKTKQNENQLAFQTNIEKLGHIYKVVRSVDEVVSIIKQY